MEVAVTILETAVLEQIKNVLLNAPDLRKLVREQLAQQVEGQTTDMVDLSQLESERKKLTEQLEFAIEHLGTLGKTAAATMVAGIEQKLAGNARRIDAAKAVRKTKPMNLDEQADAIVHHLHQLAGAIHTLPPKALRGLLESAIDRLEIDLENGLV